VKCEAAGLRRCDHTSQRVKQRDVHFTTSFCVDGCRFVYVLHMPLARSTRLFWRECRALMDVDLCMFFVDLCMFDVDVCVCYTGLF